MTVFESGLNNGLGVPPKKKSESRHSPLRFTTVLRTHSPDKKNRDRVGYYRSRKK